jgi:molybdate transport system substrate-binding protein
MNRRRPIVPAAARRAALVALAAGAIVALALGGTARARTTSDPLTIYGAASLREAFSAYDSAPRYSFAGSNVLETQIRNGAPADIFASAAPLNTQRLYAAGLVERPVTFTANRLALIVPKSNPAGIGSVYDLKRKNVKLVIANSAVPVGRYTRTVLRRLSLGSVLSSVVSQESDVKAVTAKVALGQADAGFAYLTDVRAVGDQVRVIPIPARAQPRVRYEIAIVARSGHKAAARAWIKGILSARGQAALKRAGFLPLPKASS